MVKVKQKQSGSLKHVFLIKGVREEVRRAADDQSDLLPASNNRLWVNGVEIVPEMGAYLRPFYERRFDWGRSAGNSIYISALCICLVVFKEERLAENMFACFKEEFVENFPKGNFQIEINLEEFIEKHKNRLEENVYSRFCFSTKVNSREVLMYKDPVSGVISADISEHYSKQNNCIADPEARKLHERRQRLIFRFFAKEHYKVKGDNFPDVMQKVEMVLSVFYWKAMENLIIKQFLRVTDMGR